MTNTLQSDELNLSIYQHGIDVNKYFLDLYFHLEYDLPLKNEWKIPNWIYENENLILKTLLPEYIISKYQIFHDCGKPYCKIYDLDTKKYHFPNHAQISQEIWLNTHDNTEENTQIAKFILMDMDIHTIKAKDIVEFSNRIEATSLILTGLAEIHANAEMFGGIESTSFKIKYKQIDRRGKQILKLINENKIIGEKNEK
jgi:hypothetical protein